MTYVFWFIGEPGMGGKRGYAGPKGDAGDMGPPGTGVGPAGPREKMDIWDHQEAQDHRG